MSHHTHKEKKKKILERNKRNLRIFQLLGMMQQNVEGAVEHETLKRRDQQKSRKPGEKKEEEVSWSAKTQEIRNRLTNKKRAATDRFNRFAATSDAGGMGR